MSALERIVEQTRTDLRYRRVAAPPRALERAAAARDPGDWRSFADALREPGVSVIAEHKRRSPSAGAIREDLELAEVVGAYERAGARALSILTEGPNFGGSLGDLRQARAAVSPPLLRKDFVVDSYQLLEAVAAGADAVLLIVAALGADELASLHGEATALGLDVLVEVHDRSELEQAVAAGAEIIGINNRDLTTLTVDLQTTFELVPQIPDGAIVVAESGFSRRDEIDELAAAGVDAVLIGEALMRSPDIEAACRALTASR